MSDEKESSKEGTADDSDGIDLTVGVEYAERGLRLLGEAFELLGDMVQTAIEKTIEEMESSYEKKSESESADEGSEAA